MHDGVRLEAVISRSEVGELVLDCGHSSKKNNPKDSRGVGVQHALEERHNVTPRDIAEVLLLGDVSAHEKASRMNERHNCVLVVLEREIRQNSGRISQTKARIQTSMFIT